MAVNTVGTIDDRVKVKTVLMSVFDKAGLDVLARALLRTNPDIQFLFHRRHVLSAPLGARGIRSRPSPGLRYTGQPEMQGGLVKTLDFKIYLGLLSETYNDSHAADLKRTSAEAIDCVVVNLYPFEQTIARPGATLEDAGPTWTSEAHALIRAAAKNFHRVTVLTDPADYAGVSEELGRPERLGQPRHEVPPGAEGLPAHRTVTRPRAVPGSTPWPPSAASTPSGTGTERMEPLRFSRPPIGDHGRHFPAGMEISFVGDEGRQTLVYGRPRG